MSDYDECPDIWHLLLDTTADACPSCGYRTGGEDDGSPWLDDVILSAEGGPTDGQ